MSKYWKIEMLIWLPTVIQNNENTKFAKPQNTQRFNQWLKCDLPITV